MAQLVDAVADRDAKIADRDAKIAKLERRVAELETQLGQNSTNSHKPPSSDPPGTRPSKPSSGRQRGGQPGHKPNKRELLPPEMVTRTTDVKLSRCAWLVSKRRRPWRRRRRPPIVCCTNSRPRRAR